MEDYISQIIDAVKALPVRCEDFRAADTWVGVVMALEEVKLSIARKPGANEEGEDNGG